MANLKLIIRKNQTEENGDCNIYVQITNRGKVDWIVTNIYENPEYFLGCRVESDIEGDKTHPTRISLYKKDCRNLRSPKLIGFLLKHPLFELLL